MKGIQFLITVSLLLLIVHANLAFGDDGIFDMYNLGQEISKDHQKDVLCKNFYLKAFPKPENCTESSQVDRCKEYYKYLNEFCSEYSQGIRVNYLLNANYARQFCTSKGFYSYQSYGSSSITKTLLNDKNNVYYICSNTDISSCKILTKNAILQGAYIKKITCKEDKIASLIANRTSNVNSNKVTTTTTNNTTTATTANNRAITTTTTTNNSTTKNSNGTTTAKASSTTPKYTCTRVGNSVYKKKDGVTIQTKSDECVSGKIHQAYCNGNEIASGYKLVPCTYGCNNTDKACNQFECNSNYGAGSNACPKEKPRCIANKCQACSATQVYSETKRACVQCDSKDTTKCSEGQVCQNNLCKNVYTCKKEGKTITKYLNGKQNGQVINDKCSGNNVMIYSCSKEESVGTSITITAKTTYCSNGCDSNTLSCKENTTNKVETTNSSANNNATTKTTTTTTNKNVTTTTTTTTSNKNVTTTNNLNISSTNSASSTTKIQRPVTTSSSTCKKPYLHVTQCTTEIDKTNPTCISYVSLCDSCNGNVCEKYMDITSFSGKMYQDELLDKGYGQLDGYGKGNRFYPPEFYGIAPAYYIPTPTPVVYSKAPQLLPRLECVTDNGDSNMTAYFGYENKTDKTIAIDVLDKREGYKNSIDGNVLSELNFEANMPDIEKAIENAIDNMDNQTILSENLTVEEIQNIVNNMYQNITYEAYKEATKGTSNRHITKFLPGIHKGVIQVVFRKGANNKISFTLQNNKEKITTVIASENSPLCKEIIPQFECIKQDEISKRAFAIFGYKNDNEFPIYIPVGKNNKVISSTSKGTVIKDLGQSTQFLPGTNNTVFGANININDNNQAWYLSIKGDNKYKEAKVDVLKNTCKNNKCKFVSIIEIKNSFKTLVNDYMSQLNTIFSKVTSNNKAKDTIEAKINKFLDAINSLQNSSAFTCQNAKNCSTYQETYDVSKLISLFNEANQTAINELNNIKENNYCDNSNVEVHLNVNHNSGCTTCKSGDTVNQVMSEYGRSKECLYITSQSFMNDLTNVNMFGNNILSFLNIFNDPIVKNRSLCYEMN